MSTLIERYRAGILRIARSHGAHVDVVTELGLRPRIRDRVLKEAVAL